MPGTVAGRCGAIPGILPLLSRHPTLSAQSQIFIPKAIRDALLMAARHKARLPVRIIDTSIPVEWFVTPLSGNGLPFRPP